MEKKLNVLIWNENVHETRGDVEVLNMYPMGIHHAIANALGEEVHIDFATLYDPDHGIHDDVLEKTDVLIWWSHIANHEVRDEIVEKVYERIHQGMGLIVLHSAHKSKIFTKLTGTSSQMKVRTDNERERLWVVCPHHPIVNGIGECIELEEEEMYGEFFDIPKPDELIFISWFEGGEVVRSGCCYQRGKGKIFYFRPGHETNPTFYHPDIKKVLKNAVQWASQGNEYLKI